MTDSRRAFSRSAGARGGYVLGLVVHVVLLLAILGMVVYLASSYRARLDLTADRLYSLTESTQRVLDRLEQRLVIEAFFSPDEELASVNQDGRRTFRNMLDELVQQGRGRVVVRYFDPQSDGDLRKKAERLGITPQRVQDMQGTTLSNKEVWQGLRLRYGGDKQKVVPFLGFTDQSWLYEASLTPIVKALTVAEKPRIGVIQWASTPSRAAGFGRQEQPRGFGRVLDIPEIKDRYAFVPVDVSVGQLVPDDLDTLLLFRPKELTERQKYAFDQFLMRGGRLVVFADSDDVEIGQQRSFATTSTVWDAQGAKSRFLEQLAHYGAVVQDKFLVDASSTQVPFVFLRPVQAGGQVATMPQQLDFYPYWYQPRALDWATKADLFATRSDQTVDEALANAFRQQFLPGVDPERAKGLIVPVLFWPCPVDLAGTLPDGVEGHVLMRSSPMCVTQVPPSSVHPMGNDPQRWADTYARFRNGLMQVLLSEQRQQHGLMVALSGTFRSWFDGREIPRRPGAETGKSADERDPLAEPVAKDPVEARDAEVQGPEAPKPDVGDGTPAKEPDPPPLLRAAPGAQLVVIGDATFLRDDLVGGDYQQMGGPVSQLGPLFLANLLDWLAQDRDLYALRSRTLGVDRRLKIVSEEELGTLPPERVQQEIDERAAWLRTWNIVSPPLLLVAFGLVVLFVRRASKRRFLVRTGS